jgi:hypothetical protein
LYLQENSCAAHYSFYITFFSARELLLRKLLPDPPNV